jgi:hypothetical protein
MIRVMLTIISPSVRAINRQRKITPQNWKTPAAFAFLLIIKHTAAVTEVISAITTTAVAYFKKFSNIFHHLPSCLFLERAPSTKIPEAARRKKVLGCRLTLQMSMTMTAQTIRLRQLPK